MLRTKILMAALALGAALLVGCNGRGADTLTAPTTALAAPAGTGGSSNAGAGGASGAGAGGASGAGGSSSAGRGGSSSAGAAGRAGSGAGAWGKP